MSGKKFWDGLCNILFESKVSVESQKCAGDLVDAVEKLTNRGTGNNVYYILFDNVFDNPMNTVHLSKLRKFSREDANIILIEDYISLEASLLSFSELISYLGKQKDLSNLVEELQARNCLLNAIDFSNSDYSVSKEIVNYRDKHKVKKSYTVESIASSILKRLTECSGFEVNKSSIGNCWLNPCCIFEDRYNDCKDIVSAKDKVINLINNSLLKDIINKVVI